MVKITDPNQLMPHVPNEDMEKELAAWYQKKTSFDANRLIREEYPAVLAMQNAWAYATHIELMP